jgi:hypothetical protein
MDMAEETILCFVRNSIKSAWALEILLLLHRDRGRRWRLETLVRELRGSAALVSKSLKMLSGAGLVMPVEDEACLYKPKSPELDVLVSSLAELYRVKPITVLQAIFTSPNETTTRFSGGDSGQETR